MTEILPNVQEDMLSPEFWVQGSHHTKNQSSVRAQNQEHILHHTDSMRSLLDIWARDRHSSIQLPTPQLPASPPPRLYNRHGEPLSAEFWADLSQRIRSAKSVIPQLQPGFSVRRANLRRYPTNEPAFREATDREFDRFQDTALHTFEPVLVLLTTSDGKWDFVLSTTYEGWVASEDIARATPDEFERWTAFTKDIGRQFLIPLCNTVYTQAAPYDEAISKINLEFASYLPLCENQESLGNQTIAGNVSVYVPVRNEDGWLVVKKALVSKKAPYHIGFLPYSRASVVDSAFALLSERYGWGDSFGNHDCSSLIMDSYRTIGLQLPRDADTQEEALPNQVLFPEHLSFDERSELLMSLNPGDPLYMPGHTMMYLGFKNGHHYVIHDFAGYTETEDTASESVTQDEDSGENTGRNIPVNEIMVSTLDIKTSRNKTYLEELTSAASLFE